MIRSRQALAVAVDVECRFQQARFAAHVLAELLIDEPSFAHNGNHIYGRGRIA